MGITHPNVRLGRFFRVTNGLVPCTFLVWAGYTGQRSFIHRGSLSRVKVFNSDLHGCGQEQRLVNKHCVFTADVPKSPRFPVYSLMEGTRWIMFTECWRPQLYSFSHGSCPPRR